MNIPHASSGALARRIEWFFLLAGLVYFIGQLFLCWNQPILDQYAFRQTQTAISAFWIAKGGNWLAYPTPVLGAPWAIPFEFPLYQWLCAGVAVLFHTLTLDQSGRLVSAVFFLGCLWPARRITRHFGEGSSLFRVASSLVLFSPLYAFWSRSLMMESTALFFSMWFVAALYDYLEEPQIFGFMEMVGAGSLAACIKITTFVGFSLAGAVIVLYVLAANIDHIKLQKKRLLRYAITATSVALVLVILEIWVHYGDNLKLLNPFGSLFTSVSLKNWNFGTLAQRMSSALRHVVAVRAPDEALGSRFIALAAIVGTIFMPCSRQRVAFFALIVLYLSAFFVFTNLHLVHHYYQYANSIFLVVAVGYLIHALFRERPLALIIVMSLVVASDAYGYHRYFYGDLTGRNREMQQLLANYVRQHTASDDIFVGFGLSWSSEVPYYAERRAIMIPDNAGSASIAQLHTHLVQSTGGHPIGAVISCPNGVADAHHPVYEKLLHDLTANRRPHYVGYCVIYQ